MTPVHPWAWWVWALSLAAALSMTTSPLLIVLLVAAVCAVVLLRRGDAPWARSLGIYAVLPGNRHVPHRLRVLMDFLVDKLSVSGQSE